MGLGRRDIACAATYVLEFHLLYNFVKFVSHMLELGLDVLKYGPYNDR